MRVGKPGGLSGLPEAHSGPAFANLVGLIHYAASEPVDLKGQFDPGGGSSSSGGGGLFDRIKRAIKDNF